MCKCMKHSCLLRYCAYIQCIRVRVQLLCYPFQPLLKNIFILSHQFTEDVVKLQRSYLICPNYILSQTFSHQLLVWHQSLSSFQYTAQLQIKRFIREQILIIDSTNYNSLYNHTSKCMLMFTHRVFFKIKNSLSTFRSYAFLFGIMNI